MPNNARLGGLGNGLVALQSETAWQWQFSTTAHDPNPPITLEDAPPAPGSFVATPFRSLVFCSPVIRGVPQ